MPRGSTKKRQRVRPELFVMLAIIFCVLFLVNYNREHRVHGAISIENGVMTVLRDQKDIDAFKELKNEIVQYQPDACRMMRMYNDDLSVVFTMFFTDIYEISNYDLANFPDLKYMYETQEEGHHIITVEQAQYDIYFKWTTNNDGAKYLLVYMSSQDAVKLLNWFNLICYITLILVFLLFFIMVFWQYRSIINQYKSVSNDAQSRRMARR